MKKQNNLRNLNSQYNKFLMKPYKVNNNKKLWIALHQRIINIGNHHKKAHIIIKIQVKVVINKKN